MKKNPSMDWFLLSSAMLILVSCVKRPASYVDLRRADRDAPPLWEKSRFFAYANDVIGVSPREAVGTFGGVETEKTRRLVPAARDGPYIRAHLHTGIRGDFLAHRRIFLSSGSR